MSMFSLNLWPKQPSDHDHVGLLPVTSVMRLLWTIYAVFEYLYSMPTYFFLNALCGPLRPSQ